MATQYPKAFRFPATLSLSSLPTPCKELDINTQYTMDKQLYAHQIASIHRMLAIESQANDYIPIQESKWCEIRLPSANMLSSQNHQLSVPTILGKRPISQQHQQPISKRGPLAISLSASCSSSHTGVETYVDAQLRELFQVVHNTPYQTGWHLQPSLSICDVPEVSTIRSRVGILANMAGSGKSLICMVVALCASKPFATYVQESSPVIEMQPQAMAEVRMHVSPSGMHDLSNVSLFVVPSAVVDQWEQYWDNVNECIPNETRKIKILKVDDQRKINSFEVWVETLQKMDIVLLSANKLVSGTNSPSVTQELFEKCYYGRIFFDDVDSYIMKKLKIRSMNAGFIWFVGATTERIFFRNEPQSSSMDCIGVTVPDAAGRWNFIDFIRKVALMAIPCMWRYVVKVPDTEISELMNLKPYVLSEVIIPNTLPIRLAKDLVDTPIMNALLEDHWIDVGTKLKLQQDVLEEMKQGGQLSSMTGERGKKITKIRSNKNTSEIIVSEKYKKAPMDFPIHLRTFLNCQILSYEGQHMVQAADDAKKRKVRTTGASSRPLAKKKQQEIQQHQQVPSVATSIQSITDAEQRLVEFNRRVLDFRLCELCLNVPCKYILKCCERQMQLCTHCLHSTDGCCVGSCKQPIRNCPTEDIPNACDQVVDDSITALMLRHSATSGTFSTAVTDLGSSSTNNNPLDSTNDCTLLNLHQRIFESKFEVIEEATKFYDKTVVFVHDTSMKVQNDHTQITRYLIERLQHAQVKVIFFAGCTPRCYGKKVDEFRETREKAVLILSEDQESAGLNLPFVDCIVIFATVQKSTYQQTQIIARGQRLDRNTDHPLHVIVPKYEHSKENEEENVAVVVLSDGISSGI